MPREVPPSRVPTSSHRRYDPLQDTWVLVSAGRDQRPWQGQLEPTVPDARPAFDPTCYLCPGNERANGERNPAYADTFVFTNDFAALRPDATEAEESNGLLRSIGERGTCRVLCFSPRHDQDLARLGGPGIRRVIDLWADQTADLGKDWRWVQLFENRGAAMGASNPHPHGQAWAGSALPVFAEREDLSQRRYLEANGSRLLLDYADQEDGGPRVVARADGWLAVVPYWAVWPFETLLVPRFPVARLPELDGGARDGLAGLLAELLARYDGLFGSPFPYSLGWHQAPFGGHGTDHWQLHAHAYPPMLRSASVRKFLVGYELLAEPQRDLTPEEAAERLRAAAPS